METFFFNVASQYSREALRWLEAVARGDNVSVLFIPKTDRFIRLGQLLNDKILLRKALAGKTRYIFQRIDFDVRDVENTEDLSHQISEHLNFSRIVTTPQSLDQWLAYLQKNNLVLVLILADAEKFLNEEGKNILALLTQLIDHYSPIIRTLSFFEVDITNPTVLALLPSSSRMYETIFKYPLYGHDDTVSFIRLFSRLWHYKIARAQEDKIIAGCGGHLWFVKEAVRELMSINKWSLEDEGMYFRIRSTYKLLLSSEQDTLRKIHGKKKISTPEESHSLAYLKGMNMIDKHNQHTIGLLKDFFLKREQTAGEFLLQDNRMMLNGISLERFFSRQERRVMKLLLSRGNEVVSRDELAKGIWPTNTAERYSDWAIDQLISRLRKRLTELSLPSTLIQSLRGKGYLLKTQAV